MLKQRHRLDCALMMTVQTLLLLICTRSLSAFTGILCSQFGRHSCGRPLAKFRIKRRNASLLLGSCAVRQLQARQDHFRLPDIKLDSRLLGLEIVDDQPQLVFARQEISREFK